MIGYNPWAMAYELELGWKSPTPEELLTAAREEFLSERKAAQDRLWQLRKLRGATSNTEMIKELGEIDTLINQASGQFDNATTAGEVERVRGLLTPIKQKAKRVKELSDGVEKAYQKELQTMPRYFEALEGAQKTRELIASLPGAKTQLVDIEKCLADGKLAVKDGNGKSPSGYEEGLGFLSKHTSILEDAKKASQLYLAVQPDPEVLKAKEEADNQLTRHRDIAPEFQTRLHEQRLAVAFESSRDNKEKAISEIKELTSAVELEIAEQEKLKLAAEEDLNAVTLLIGELKSLNVPAAEYLDLSHALERAQNTDFPGREYRQAGEDLARAKQLGTELKLERERKQEELVAWQQTKGPMLQTIVDQCRDWLNWPPLSGPARDLLQEARQLETKVAKDLDFVAGANALKQLEQRCDILWQEARKGDVPSNLELRELTEHIKKGRDLVDNLRDQVGVLLNNLSAKMVDVKNKRATPFHADFDEVLENWRKFMANPVGSKNVLKAVTTRTNETLQLLKAIGENVQQLLNNKKELAGVLVEAKKQDKKEADEARPKHIEALLAELEKFKVDVKRERTVFGNLTGENPPKNAQEMLERLEKQLEERTNTERKGFAEKQDKERKNIELIDGSLGVFESDYPQFKAYVLQLKAQSNDLKEMLATDDPYLYEKALEERSALIERIRQIDPKSKTRKPGKTLEEVEKRWKQLGKRLGEGNLILNRLPDTHKRLKIDLEKLTTQAARTDPDTGFKLFDAVDLEITEAKQKAELANAEYKGFESKKKALEERWSALVKSTRTWITDRTTAYEARYKTQLADALETAKQEGKIAEALQKLTVIDNEFKTIEDDKDPRKALQDLDVAAQREQELVADLARQFDGLLKFYRETTLESVRKAQEGVKDADKDMLDSLERSGDQAELIVKPYLAIISKWPVTKMRANKSPLVAKATEDFARARRILADATRSAQGLISNPGDTTNVHFTGDLEKLGKDWARDAAAYAKAVKELAGAIKTDAKEVVEPKDQNEEALKKADTIAKAIKAVEPDLNFAANRFSTVAFATPLGVLCNDTATESARKAAREQALRTVRRFTNDLLTHPVLVTINDPKNPFRNLNRETSMLRATLKKLQLEVLVGI